MLCCAVLCCDVVVYSSCCSEEQDIRNPVLWTAGSTPPYCKLWCDLCPIHIRQTLLHHSIGGKLVCVCYFVYSAITLSCLVCDNSSVNRLCTLSHLNTVCSIRLCLQLHVFSYVISTISCDQFSSLPRDQPVALPASRVLHDVRGRGTPKVEATSNVIFLGFYTVQHTLMPYVSKILAACFFRVTKLFCVGNQAST